jgi:hypothetical protein
MRPQATIVTAAARPHKIRGKIKPAAGVGFDAKLAQANCGV